VEISHEICDFDHSTAGNLASGFKFDEDCILTWNLSVDVETLYQITDSGYVSLEVLDYFARYIYIYIDLYLFNYLFIHLFIYLLFIFI
jgi:hypothetical protein